MQKHGYIFAIILITLNITSLRGQLTERNFKKNYKYTEKLSSKLAKKNGISFYITYTHANISWVWTYADNQLVSYTVVKGKINKVNKYDIKKEEEWKQSFSKINLIDELSSCDELDGGLLGINYQIDNKIKRNLIGVDLHCFLDMEHKIPALKNLVGDIKKTDIFDSP